MYKTFDFSIFFFHLVRTVECTHLSKSSEQDVKLLCFSCYSWGSLPHEKANASLSLNSNTALHSVSFHQIHSDSNLLFAVIVGVCVILYWNLSVYFSSSDNCNHIAKVSLKTQLDLFDLIFPIFVSTGFQMKSAEKGTIILVCANSVFMK